MFNGIIFNTGIIEKIDKKKNFFEITVRSQKKFKTNEVGASVSCNGTCLTLTKVKDSLISSIIGTE